MPHGMWSVSSVTFVVARQQQQQQQKTTWTNSITLLRERTLAPRWYSPLPAANDCNDLTLQINTHCLSRLLFFFPPHAANRIWMGTSCWSALRSEESPYTSRGKRWQFGASNSIYSFHRSRNSDPLPLSFLVSFSLCARAIRDATGMCPSVSSAIVWQWWPQTRQIRPDRTARPFKMCRNFNRW